MSRFDGALIIFMELARSAPRKKELGNTMAREHLCLFCIFWRFDAKKKKWIVVRNFHHCLLQLLYTENRWNEILNLFERLIAVEQPTTEHCGMYDPNNVISYYHPMIVFISISVCFLFSIFSSKIDIFLCRFRIKRFLKLNAFHVIHSL